MGKNVLILSGAMHYAYEMGLDIKSWLMRRSFLNILLYCLLAVSLAGTVASCGNSNGAPEDAVMRDGDWEGLGEGRSGMIKVSMHVDDNTIISIIILSQSESVFAQEAENTIIQEVIQNNSTDGVDAVSGATLTSNGMLEAINSAIDASKGITAEEVEYTDTSCDVVVIGAGGAGLAAALEAAICGADVIVLEKQGIIGGNTNSSTGGLNAAETSVQEKLGIVDSKEKHFDDTMIGGYYINDPELVRTLTGNAAAAVEWLIGNGADLSDVGKLAGSSVPRAHRPQNGAAIGPHLMSVLHNAVDKADIDIRTRNKVCDLILEDGKVTGVVVEAAAKTYRIRAEATVIATGGFGANPDMIESYRSDLKGFNTSNHSGATGDAFGWASPLDMALRDMEQIQTHPTGEVSSHLLITEAVRGNGAVLVNKEGLRFANEMLTRDKLSEAILAQTGRRAFLVFDEAVRSSLAAIENYAQQGLLKDASTYEALAAQMKVPAEALIETMFAYSGFYEAGCDADFGRPAEDMPLPLTQSPFYAIEVEPVIHHTMGGLKINQYAQVLNGSDEIIPGLYAAGEVTGGVHGGNRLGGNAVADIIVFGRIAGSNASKYAK